jgi:hypothetical protein
MDTARRRTVPPVRSSNNWPAPSSRCRYRKNGAGGRAGANSDHRGLICQWTDQGDRTIETPQGPCVEEPIDVAVVLVLVGQIAGNVLGDPRGSAPRQPFLAIGRQPGRLPPGDSVQAADMRPIPGSAGRSLIVSCSPRPRLPAACSERLSDGRFRVPRRSPRPQQRELLNLW